MRHPSIVRIFTPLLVVASLSSCASVSPVALAKLAALDPLSADPAMISVAARLPQALKLRKGDLVMAIKIDGAEGPDKLDEKFLLDIVDAKSGDAGVIMPLEGERLVTARVAPQDMARLKAAQAKAAALKSTGKYRGKGSLSVSAQGGCKTGDITNVPLIMNLFMTTESGGDWFSVVSDMDLRKQLGDDLIAKIPPCA